MTAAHAPGSFYLAIKKRFDTRATSAIVALAVMTLVLSTAPVNSLIFLKIFIIGIVIFSAGHAVLSLLNTRYSETSGTGAAYRNPNYLALALGPGVVLIASIILRALDLHTVSSTIAFLCATIVLASAKNHLSHEPVVPRYIQPNSLAIVYAGAAFFLWIIFDPGNYPFRTASAVYLTQGFDLFTNKDPAEWPYFGEKFSMPLMYVTHTIGTTFALFSSGDPAIFFIDGQYWLNGQLLMPIVPIGAYLFFRRFFSASASVIVSALFIYSILDVKVWNIRGESLGWIIGFGFLLALADLLSIKECPTESKPDFKKSIVVAILFFAMSLTHGVVAMIAAFGASALSVFVWTYSGRSERIAHLKSAGVFAACLAVLGLSYYLSFSELPTPHSPALEYTQSRAGTPDAALQFEEKLQYPKKMAIPLVRAAPPYLEMTAAFQIAALLPPASAFRTGFAEIRIDSFPDRALKNLRTLSRGERWIYLILLTVCCAFFVFSRSRSDALDNYRKLFWMCIGIYVGIILFSLYLNAVSTSIFPLAAIRRTFVYVRFFYWLAIFVTMVSVLHIFFKRFISDSEISQESGGQHCSVEPIRDWSVRFQFLNLVFLIGRAEPVRQSLQRLIAVFLNVKSGPDTSVKPAFGLLCVLVSWLFISTSTALDKRPDVSALLARFGERISGILALGSATAKMTTRTTQQAAGALIDAVAYIQTNTKPGDWVFSNIISDNQFWYLTRGRYSLLEGSAMYQVYDLQKRAAFRFDKFAQFAETAEISKVANYDLGHVLIYKYCQCVTQSCYGFNVIPSDRDKFDSNPDFYRAYENSEFIIYSPTKNPGGEVRQPAAPFHGNGSSSCYADYLAAFSQGINFSNPGSAAHFQSITGLSSYESSGRWSIGERVDLNFLGPLPRKFTLHLRAVAFGPNVDNKFILRLGSVTREFIISGQINETRQSIRVPLVNPDGASTLSFHIPQPTSPHDLDANSPDKRKIGLGLLSLSIE